MDFLVCWFHSNSTLWLKICDFCRCAGCGLAASCWGVLRPSLQDNYPPQSLRWQDYFCGTRSWKPRQHRREFEPPTRCSRHKVVGEITRPLESLVPTYLVMSPKMSTTSVPRQPVQCMLLHVICLFTFVIWLDTDQTNNKERHFYM